MTAIPREKIPQTSKRSMKTVMNGLGYDLIDKLMEKDKSDERRPVPRTFNQERVVLV